MGTEVLFDADSLMYKAGFSAETPVAQVEDFRAEGKGHKAAARVYCEEHGIPEEAIEFSVDPQPLEYALQIVKAYFTTTMNALEVQKKDIHVLLSDSVTFRHKLATILPYKANRLKMRKSYWHYEIRKYLEDHWGGLMLPDLEADDLCALWMGENKIIASIDKDLDTVAGDHWNWSKRERYYVTEQEARTFFWQQVFQGDKGDNIPGLPFATPEIIEKYGLTGHARRGIGEVNAKRLASKAETDWDLYRIARECFIAAEEEMAVQVGREDLVGDSRLIMGAEKDLLEVGRLLHMCREIKEDGTPVLWEIPTDPSKESTDV